MCQEAHPEVRSGLGGPPGSPELVRSPPGGLGLVGMPFRKSCTGREVFPVVRDRSGGPCRGQRRVKRPTRKSGMGQEAHQEVRDESRGPPRGAGLVGRTSRRCRMGQKAHPEDRDRSRAHLEVRDGY